MIEPLHPVPVPTHAVLAGIHTGNSWRADEGGVVRYAYVATNSTERLSFVSLHAATTPWKVAQLASRPSLFPDMPYGVVVEVYLLEDLAENEFVYVTLAQAGATAYFPPQPIEDRA